MSHTTTTKKKEMRKAIAHKTGTKHAFVLEIAEPIPSDSGTAPSEFS
jgi:hypothetical protein